MTVHSKYGASSIKCVMACPGYIQAIEGIEDEGNKAADLGTAAHLLGEKCLKLGCDTHDLLGTTIDGFEVDHNMADAVQVYVNHIRALRLQNPDGKSMLEERLCMSSVSPDVFGTSDHVLIALRNRVLYIDDYKHGFGVVDEDDNPQTAHYGVSALDTFDLWWAVDKVICTIVQPRADHRRGAIRTAEYTIEEMMQWQSRFKTAIEKSKAPDAKRIPGEHCRYCKAQGNCRPRLIKTILLASIDAPLNTFGVEELNGILQHKASLIASLEAFEKQATLLARSGYQFDNFKLVKGITRAQCTDEQAFIKEAVKKGAKKEDLFNPGNLKGKTVLKKEGVDAEVVDKYFKAEPAQTKLVDINKSAPAVSSQSAEGVFKPVPSIE